MEDIVYKTLKNRMEKSMLTSKSGGIFSSETWSLIKSGEVSLLAIILEVFSFYLSYCDTKDMNGQAPEFLGLDQETFIALIDHSDFMDVKKRGRSFNFSILERNNIDTASIFLRGVIRTVMEECSGVIARTGVDPEVFSRKILGVGNETRRELVIIPTSLNASGYMKEVLSILLPKKENGVVAVDNLDSFGSDVDGEENFIDGNFGGGTIVEVVDIPINEGKNKETGEVVDMIGQEKKPITIDWLRGEFCRDGNTKKAIPAINRFFLLAALTASKDSAAIAAVLLDKPDIHNFKNICSVKSGVNPEEHTVSLENFSSLGEVLGAFIRSYIDEERTDLIGEILDVAEHRDLLTRFCRENYFQFAADCVNPAAVKMGYIVPPGEIKIFTKEDFPRKAPRISKGVVVQAPPVSSFNEQVFLEEDLPKEAIEEREGGVADFIQSQPARTISTEDIIVHLQSLNQVEQDLRKELADKIEENSVLRGGMELANEVIRLSEEKLVSAQERISFLEAECAKMREILSEFMRLSQKIEN